MRSGYRLYLSAAGAVLAALSRLTHGQVAGALGVHDPSSVIKDGSTYYLFGTGQGIAAKTSTDRVTWTDQPSGVFASPPAWTTQAVPSFTGGFWAPDVAYFNGKYHLYYSVSSWGTIDSAIGVATSPTLNRSSPSYGWTDLGKVVQSDANTQAGPNTDTTAYNAIDPSILVDTNGSVYMAFGSYSSGILVTQLDPTTGKRLNTASLQATQVANNAPGGGWGSSIEGAALVKHGTYYYLFVNYGGCCSGVNSTYNIRVGRSTSATGPFLDEKGVDMKNGGGTLFLGDDGKRIGPGHFSLFSESGQDYFGYHYYNGDANGAPTYNMSGLTWTTDQWPSAAAVNPDWLGAASANWTNAANWGLASVPNGTGHVANFSANAFARYSVALDAPRTVGTINFQTPSSYTLGVNAGNALTLDGATGEMATLNVSAGSHALAAPLVALDRLGVNTFTGTRLTLSGSLTGTGLTKYGFGSLVLSGPATFNSSLLLRWGTLDVTGSITTTGFTSVAVNTNENATLRVRGAALYSASADVNVGDTGDASTPATGTLFLQDTARITITSGGLFVGSGFFANTRAVGTVNQSGGSLTVTNAGDGYFILGGRNSALATGTYNLTAGTLTANTNVRIGGLGTGIFNQSGGVFTTPNYLALGRFAGATGAYTLTGGSLNLTSATQYLLVGESGAGTLTIDLNGLATTANLIHVGQNAGAIGAINLDGGTLATTGIIRGAGTATLNFDGGTLMPAATSTTFLQGLTAAYVKAGGARVDTNGKIITLGQPLLHHAALGTALDGGFTKNGAGTLALAGTNTFTGPIAVNAGLLLFSPGGNATSSLTIAAGAKARFLNSTNALAATLSIAGADNAWTGQLDIASASLVVPTTTANKAQTLSTLANQLTTGKAAAWTGNGITSSSVAADATGQLTVALVDNADLGLATFKGRTVNSGSLLITRAVFGDADLSGTVDLGDFDRWFAHVGSASYSFAAGDFDLSGQIDLGDFDRWFSNVGTTMVLLEPEARAAAVPEPGSLALLTLALAPLLVRRRPAAAASFGLGDAVASVAAPIASLINALAGTRLGQDGCACKQRHAFLNKLVPHLRNPFAR